eukprot:1977077-Prymnesium_polylepis.1
MVAWSGEHCTSLMVRSVKTCRRHVEITRGVTHEGSRERSMGSRWGHDGVTWGSRGGHVCTSLKVRSVKAVHHGPCRGTWGFTRAEGARLRGYG